MQIAQHDARMTDTREEALDFSQFQETSIQILISATLVLGTLTALFGSDFGLTNWQVGLLALWIMIWGLFALLRFTSNDSSSALLLHINWLGTIFGLLWIFSSNPPFLLLTLPILFACLFLSPIAGVMTWILTGALSFLWLRANQLPLGDWGLFIAVTGSMLLIIWMFIRNINEMVRWSWQTYRQGRDELTQAREQRGQLNQAIHDLAEANVQMMRLNHLLNAARYQAEEAERVKAEFVANVSHELRTPLNMILGYCELIMDFPAVYGKKLPARLVADIAAIKRNSQHLSSLINDVLDISQFEAQRMVLRKEWVAIQDVVQEAIIAVRPLLESRNLNLETHIPDDLPLLHCDQTRIRQVLLNLVSNAARVTETGGITIQVELGDEQIRVTVCDTGPGIAAEDMPKLFQPFGQLDGGLNRKHGGSGLGLNISRNFIELHGGKIGVDSQPGVGSSFWFTLPLHGQAETGNGYERWLSAEYDQRTHPTYANRRRILPRVVVLEMASYLYDQALRLDAEIEVERAETPEEALTILNTSPCQVIVVRGETEAQTREWASRVSSSHYQTPVASCWLPKENGTREVAVERYLVKPVDHRQLFETIAALQEPVRSILLVDDDMETVQLFTRILSSGPKKYRVLQANAGEEALKLLHSRAIDLIILDLHMPGMDGYAFLEEKNRQPAWSQIPVVILSAEDPSGYLQAVPNLTITCDQGLSVPQLFKYALKLTDG